MCITLKLTPLGIFCGACLELHCHCYTQTNVMAIEPLRLACQKCTQKQVCMYMYVLCVCVYIYIYIYLHTYIYIYTHTHTHTYIHMYVCMHLCTAYHFHNLYCHHFTCSPSHMSILTITHV